MGSVQIFRQVALSLKPWILRQVCAPKEFIIRRTVRGDRKERITSPIVASDGIVVFSFFDRTLIALLTRIQPLFWPIKAAASILILTSIGNGFLSRDLADIVIVPFVTLLCCHTALNDFVTLRLYGRISDRQLLSKKTWTS